MPGKHAAARASPRRWCCRIIAAPSDPGHGTGLFKDEIADIRAQGEREVVLAGRPFRIRREFLDDVAEQHLLEHVVGLHRALLVLHSPTDDTVGIDNASRIFPPLTKSFVSTVDADQLLSRHADALSYAAHVIAAWAEQGLRRWPQPAAADEGRPVVAETRTASSSSR